MLSGGPEPTGSRGTKQNPPGAILSSKPAWEPEESANSDWWKAKRKMRHR